MSISITIQFGTSTVTVTDTDLTDAIDRAAFFDMLPRQCPECGAGVHFTARHPRGFHYFGLRCDGSPAHETTFGVHKEGGGLFYKEREAWTVAYGQPDPDFDAPAPTREQLVDDLKRLVSSSGWTMKRFLEVQRVPDPTAISEGRIRELIGAARALGRSAS